MNKHITMDSVESSQIFAIGFDAETNTLAIRFKNRRTGEPTSLYYYRNFSEADFAAFRDAESKGAHFGQHIKPFEERFPYEKIESTPTIAEEQQ